MGTYLMPLVSCKGCIAIGGTRVCWSLAHGMHPWQADWRCSSLRPQQAGHDVLGGLIASLIEGLRMHEALEAMECLQQALGHGILLCLDGLPHQLQ